MGPVPARHAAPVRTVIDQHGVLRFVTSDDSVGPVGGDDDWAVALWKREEECHLLLGGEALADDDVWLETREEAAAVVRALAVWDLDLSSVRDEGGAWLCDVLGAEVVAPVVLFRRHRGAA